MGGPGFESTYPLLMVSWTTAGADQAWIVQGTSDAADSMFMQIPLNGSQSDFQNELRLGCNGDPTVFTMTLVGTDGSHVSKSFTVQATGDVF